MGSVSSAFWSASYCKLSCWVFFPTIFYAFWGYRYLNVSLFVCFVVVLRICCFDLKLLIIKCVRKMSQWLHKIHKINLLLEWVNLNTYCKEMFAVLSALCYKLLKDKQDDIRLSFDTACVKLKAVFACNCYLLVFQKFRLFVTLVFTSFFLLLVNLKTFFFQEKRISAAFLL